MLTLFGGEPLLNLPVAYDLTERLWHASQALGVRVMMVNAITNGLLLTPAVADPSGALRSQCRKHVWFSLYQ